MASTDPPIEIPPWLKSLPLAPSYHPTLTEFQDPISYILKIEKEASLYGICKIVPPLPPPPKKTTLTNLNRSFSSRNNPSSKKQPTFSTRHQQIGFCPRRPRPVQKPVWQSGDSYTLSHFESMASKFQHSLLKKTKKPSKLTDLEADSLFWKACADKPISVEYANDMPGSGFSPLVKKWGAREEEAENVGETAWNMRGVSRAKGSLLRFMKEEIPGVTSPMVYVAMMFSWFAWHVEDHELHSLNFLHMGAGKTWYGVPRDAGFAFEEVVRMQGYGGEVNPLVTFTILGEKTTVMSPEVIITAGIPCCRLVQNAGEFVVTFPGAYHSGFSHGFNCAEAANIATPEWLRVAKDAAIRRACINYPPMVSHFQLLYALALSLCSRMPSSGEPRSSRLKDKMRGEGEVMVKEIFVQNVVETNDLLSILLDKGSSCIILPQNASDSPLCSNPNSRSQLKIKPRLSLGLCSREEALEASRNFPLDDVMLGKNVGTLISTTCSKSGTADFNSLTSDSQHVENEKGSTVHGDGLLDQALLSCVTCGILSYTCVAVVHPREETARYLMSADCGFLNDQGIDSGKNSDTEDDTTWKRINCDLVPGPDHNDELVPDASPPKGISALDLLASAYGDSSDSEEDGLQEFPLCTDDSDPNHDSRFATNHLVREDCQYGLSTKNSHCNAGSDDLYGLRSASADDRLQMKLESSDGSHPENIESALLNNLEDNKDMETSSASIRFTRKPNDGSCREVDSNCHTNSWTDNIHQSDVKMGSIKSGSAGLFWQTKDCFGSAAPTGTAVKATQSRNFDTVRNNSVIAAVLSSDRDSCRMHVFCLEHAVEVEKLLRPLGGVDIMLLCHQDYPKIEGEAKLLAEDLGRDYKWKNIDFREATQSDREKIRTALEDEESLPTNSDWAVKLGINLYYSANLSKSPLYSKQMPYNAVIYKAFGCNSPNNSPVKPKAPGRRTGRQKKIVVAGKWCGKVWMSNQVHPYLAHRKDAQGQELAEKFHSQDIPDKKFKEAVSETILETSLPKKSSGISISATRSSAKRKRKALVRTDIKKPRCTPKDNRSKATEDAAETSPATSGRPLRSCRKLNLRDEDDGGPSTRLRRRPSKFEVAKTKPIIVKKQGKRKAKKDKAAETPIVKDEKDDEEYICDIEGCSMSFGTKQDLALHKKDICPEKGCCKKFFSHKYLLQHRKVHMDDRPLECPWKGCKMRFKWAWARTEHIRVHTGDRPYVCRECGQTFRFVSDFSRHKRKTGHLTKKGRR